MEKDSSQNVSQIVLKDGRVIPITARQSQSLALGVLTAKDLDKRKVRLNGIEFFLGDIEDDPKKIFAAAQTEMIMGDVHKSATRKTEKY